MSPPPELTSFKDTVFSQDFHVAYPVVVNGTTLAIRSIAVTPQGDAWVATAAGVFNKKSGKTEWVDAIPNCGPATSIVLDGDSTVWISTWDAIYRFSENRFSKIEGTESPISNLTATPAGIYACGPHGIWLFSDDTFRKQSYGIARSIRDVTYSGSNLLWIGTDVGLYQLSSRGPAHYADTSHLISAYIRGVALDHQGNVWAGGLGGVSILDTAAKKLKQLTPANGIPSYEVRCVQRSPDDVMWVGTDAGVVRYSKDGTHSLRFSRRWLLNDKVNDIAFDVEGNAWIATEGGVSVICKKKMTLASKSTYFYALLMRRHIREPWIAGQCRLPIAGDTTKWEPEDDDNDGEYTGNYLAMESFRYAATGSGDAKAKAKKAFEFLTLLEKVTGSDGFFARTIVPTGWSYVHDGNRTYTEEEKAEELIKEPRFKPVATRWRTSKDGTWLWKGDTSSDEICGHMFGYYFYHELVADAAEKKVIAKHVAKIVDHLISHNFTLTDVDGKPSRWGIWTPEKLNHDPEWAPDRSLNSMELLSFVKLAYHVTGDQKYQDTYLKLINEEKYLENMAKIPHQNPAWFIYFDVMLAAYQYPILLGCEKDPKLLKFYEDHMDQWIKMRANDGNPLINFLYSYCRNKKEGLKASIEFLTDTPLDLVDWTIDHTKRADVKIVHYPVLDEVQVNVLQPASIRATVRWDKNPWSISPGNHHVEREPVFWLLPYWMGQYLKMIN
ncbi:MAG: regulator [Chryseolinea sp.]